MLNYHDQRNHFIMPGASWRHFVIAVSSHMRILGIDPGLRSTGFGVLDFDGGQQLRYVASGVIRTADAPQGDLPARLKLLFDGIGELKARYQPDVAAVEIVFVNVNPQATLLLGQARGACLTALVASGLPVAEYTALQMKKAVAGHGKAAKAQVQAMVQRLLQLPAAPRSDAADALGLAITHAHAGQTIARLHAAGLHRTAASMYQRRN
jgi:crossover junction endodeoxyribonuclease RuvC